MQNICSRSPASTLGVFFIFTFFKKKITEIYFGFQNLQFYTPTARQGGGRGTTAPCWAVGTSLQIKIKFICE